MGDYTFFVAGIPAPQGSKRHVGNGRLIEQSKKVKPWRQLVDAQARIVAETLGKLPDGPVGVEVTFYFIRPASAKGRAYPHKGGPGDIDKLVRSTLDALTTSKIWSDDSQVVDLSARKRYLADGVLTTGATISIYSM